MTSRLEYTKGLLLISVCEKKNNLNTSGVLHFVLVKCFYAHQFDEVTSK